MAVDDPPRMAPAKTRTIRLRAFIHASPTKVFKAVSEPELLSRWLLDHATISPRKGGRFTFTWEDGPTHTGTVLQFVPGRRIALSWQWPGMEDLLVTKLAFSVEPKNRGTVLTLTHSGFPEQKRWVDLYGGAIQGWTYFLMNLKSFLDHGADLRSPYDW
jgi:uncharacterized protein YndB with AHSA1/START domain